ncbi:hypothetical protein GLOTRDRAFT_134831 [Gloeophyllum trabeum ATCC 11539]|uniref:Uncharacterized protein n=1 Tax=Gloeophyllum trabeum (strain ATCC 11539 / FP-39264 / Madison 617) TaxID=670483 RepID=S7S2R7_GLOTA|nr:uncharacterized protein GLOTRDRAFT_134831 [Gloeophyllum trabeum ATCC 11539]EPQ60074.1 hypothetical protein GLOTRDRAFT_134831 [Gloeophyllum trabeum ATCC 11539]
MPSSIEGWLHLTPEKNEAILEVRPMTLQALPDTEPQERLDLADTSFQAASLAPGEIWVLLDLDQERWKSYTKFTLRISWPASHPTDFRITIDSPGSSSSYPNPDTTVRRLPSTRIKFAKITLVHTGVPTPPRTNQSLEPVPFIIMLEPLQLGIIPASVTPILLGLIPLICVASLLAGRAYKYMDTLARDIAEDVKAKDE